MGSSRPTQQDQPRKGNRRDTLEAMRRQQKAGERRKTLLVVGAAGALGLGLIAATAVPAILDARNDPAGRDYSSFGVPAADAACDDVVKEDTSGSNVHVEPGTRVTYKTVPPSSGEHLGTPAAFPKKFYTEDDRPAVEELVHNLEHGYTVLWYAEDATDAERETLEGLAERGAEDEATGGKFKVAPWDTSYGEFPEGKRFGLAHWGAEQGARQLCGELSGEVVGQFLEAHPYTDSPEPNGA